METIRLRMLISGSLVYGINEQGKTSGKIRMLRITDIDKLGYLKHKNPIYVNECALKHVLESGDILLARSGSVGKTFYYEGKSNEVMTFAGYLIRARINRSVAEPKFIYYCTLTQDFENWKNNVYTQTTIPNINAEKYSNLKVPLHSLEVQRQIVKYLDWKVGLIDRDITATKKLIKNIKDLKTSHISKIISGEKRLSKDTANDFIFVNLRWLEKYPSDWEIIRLKFVSTYTTGNSINDFKKSSYADSTDARKYVATADIDKETLEIKHKSNIFIKHSDTSFKVAPKGSTLVCVEGGSGGKKVAFTEEDVSFVGKLCAIKPNKLLVNKYVYYLVLSNTFKKYYNYSINGDRNGVNLKNLGNFSFPLPPLEEQELIVKHLDSFVRIVKDFLQTSTAKLENLLKFRQSLITEVVTGQLDVSNITVPEYTKFDFSDLSTDLDEEADLDSNSTQEAE